MAQIKLSNDSLDRGRYARSLCKIISDYNITIKKKDGYFIGKGHEKEEISITKPLNSTDNKAFIMAVSAPWGTGKTMFMHMLKDAISKNNIESGDELFSGIPSLDPAEITIYNTWVNDFYDNPLEPFVKVLIKTVLHAQSEARLADRGIRATGDAVLQAGKETVIDSIETPNLNIPNDVKFAKAVTHFVCDLFKRTKDVQNAIDPEVLVNEIVGEGSSFESQLEEVRELILEQIKTTKNKKIVIIIDELDRCKPIFAVKTLEIVKHLFNIPGIVYIFSLDIIQLQHCVRTVYGNGFDAVGYLERFFDYTTLLPQGDTYNLFLNTLNEFGVEANQELSDGKQEKIAPKKDILNTGELGENKILEQVTQADIYYKICRQFHLSVREIRAVCSAFHYLNEYELQEYPYHAKQLYFYLLVLKYKEPVKVMNAISDSTASQEIRANLLKEYPPIFYPRISNDEFFGAVFTANPIIGEYKQFLLINNNGKPVSSQYYPCLPDLMKPKTSMGYKNNTFAELTDGGSLSYSLYAPDFDNLDTIKGLHLLEYFFRKVELYDTAIHPDSTD